MNRRSEALAQLLETALSERSARPLIELLRAMPIPLAVLHADDLRVLALNAAMTQVFHRAAGDAVGLTIATLLPPAHPLRDPRHFRAVARTGRPYDSTAVIDAQTWRWFIRPLQGEDRTVEHLLLGLVEVGAGGANSDLARLQETNAAKTEFLNLAAHELRTPLSVIHGYASLLAQGG